MLLRTSFCQRNLVMCIVECSDGSGSECRAMGWYGERYQCGRWQRVGTEALCVIMLHTCHPQRYGQASELKRSVLESIADEMLGARVAPAHAAQQPDQAAAAAVCRITASATPVVTSPSDPPLQFLYAQLAFGEDGAVDRREVSAALQRLGRQRGPQRAPSWLSMPQHDSRLLPSSFRQWQAWFARMLDDAALPCLGSIGNCQGLCHHCGTQNLLPRGLTAALRICFPVSWCWVSGGQATSWTAPRRSACWIRWTPGTRGGSQRSNSRPARWTGARCSRTGPRGWRACARHSRPSTGTRTAWPPWMRSSRGSP